MKRIDCRMLFGKLILLCAGLLIFTSPSFAQSANGNLPAGTAWGNFGAGGAYGEFDLGTTSGSSVTRSNVYGTAGSAGDYGNTSFKTNEAPGQHTYGDSARTSNQRLNLPLTSYVPLDKVFGGGRGLPRTTLDSFVKNSGGSADQIYGDEGADGLPPFFGFDSGHRIERGIQSGNLTTGHRSGLPEAWGWPQ